MGTEEHTAAPAGLGILITSVLLNGAVGFGKLWQDNCISQYLCPLQALAMGAAFNRRRWLFGSSWLLWGSCSASSCQCLSASLPYLSFHTSQPLTSFRTGIFIIATSVTLKSLLCASCLCWSLVSPSVWDRDRMEFPPLGSAVTQLGCPFPPAAGCAVTTRWGGCARGVAHPVSLPDAEEMGCTGKDGPGYP